nr:MAG TPA: hypothetical protein [Caudoviricetes sp.]
MQQWLKWSKTMIIKNKAPDGAYSKLNTLIPSNRPSLH